MMHDMAHRPHRYMSATLRGRMRRMRLAEHGYRELRHYRHARHVNTVVLQCMPTLAACIARGRAS